MEKYVKPSMDVELFLADIITTSAPVSCGATDDELPIIPFPSEEESDWG